MIVEAVAPLSLLSAEEPVSEEHNGSHKHTLNRPYNENNIIQAWSIKLNDYKSSTRQIVKALE